MELQKINKGGLIMEKKLSIITGNIEKGGTGKTTTIYNLGGYACRKFRYEGAVY